MFKSIFAMIAFVFSSMSGPQSELPNIKVFQPDKGIYLVKVKSASNYWVEPVVADKLTSVSDVYAEQKYKLVLNGGYFDTNNGETTSYVIINKKIVADPTKNLSLMNNDALIPHMDKILNRGEFRVLNCNYNTKYSINYHNDEVLQGCKLVHSIQAGPILDDRMDLEKEYFLVEKDGQVVRDSISATKKVARTAIATKDNDLFLIIVTDKNPMTIKELSAYIKDLGFSQAMAFDGGSSTSFKYKDIEIVSSGDGMGRKVKSFLTIN